jgi:hypothetical protein
MELANMSETIEIEASLGKSLAQSEKEAPLEEKDRQPNLGEEHLPIETKEYQASGEKK